MIVVKMISLLKCADFNRKRKTHNFWLFLMYWQDETAFNHIPSSFFFFFDLSINFILLFLVKAMFGKNFNYFVKGYLKYVFSFSNMHLIYSLSKIWYLINISAESIKIVLKVGVIKLIPMLSQRIVNCSILWKQKNEVSQK